MRLALMSEQPALRAEKTKCAACKQAKHLDWFKAFYRPGPSIHLRNGLTIQPLGFMRETICRQCRAHQRQIKRRLAT